MAERRELISICEMLDISNANNQTDIELLRSIVKKLDSGSNGNEKLSKLEPLNLPDSLAFPKEARESSEELFATQFWEDLRKFNDLLKQDYACRRQMLLNRLDCTVESFKWKGEQTASNQKHNNKKKENSQGQSEKSPNELIHEKYVQARTGLDADPNVTVSHLLALRETECDKLLNGVVSTKTVDCQVAYKSQQRINDSADELVSLKQIIIPDVPDRGGRTGEHREPPKETFSRQFRGGRGRGGRR